MARPGGHVRLGGTDQARLRARLISTFGLTPAAFDLGRIPEDADRATLSRLVGNEKLSGIRIGGAGPDRAAFCRMLLRLGGHPVAMEPEQFADIRPAGVIVVENRLAFDRFDRISFPVPDGCRDWIPVFRGSPEWPQDVMQRGLELTGAPVLAFPDYDPAGLSQSLTLPHFVDVLWPGEEALTRAVSSGRGNADRFLLQLAGHRARLEACEHPTIRKIWQILDRHGRVPAQEFFLIPDQLPAGVDADQAGPEGPSPARMKMLSS
ncbi:hypothetical protein [Paracoccus sp. ME4]|uniref:DUF7281 domain-containing protein n=1 Tax=Paracoccus sp. ME4 TaxID=3138066 RepID=UPI00398B1C57